MASRITVAVYPDAALAKMSRRQIQDSLAHLDPDIIGVSDQQHAMEISATRTDRQIIPVTPRNSVWISDGPGPQVVCIRDPTQLEAIEDAESSGEIDTATETFLLSSVLDIDIDLTQLTTELVGRDEYERELRDVSLNGSYTHMTPNAAPGYDSEWGELRVCGVMPGADETGVDPTADIALLSLYGDGAVGSKTVDATGFGLQSVERVGPKTAVNLREAGYTSVKDVAEADLHELMQLDGFGRKTAEHVVSSARAVSDGVVYRQSSDSLPSQDPVFIDIETDGLTPTMIWLIGVLDSKTGEYMSFLETDPDKPGQVVEAFMMWFAANARNRPIVAYNGEAFDFPALHDHANQYCPDLSDAWENAYTFDPYWWGVKQNNVILPGKSNKLGDVAEALGWESDETGLTGEIVGKRFQAWMADPCDETALEWEQHEAYCEDDVRALQYVYDSIRDAPRMDGVQQTDGGSSSESSGTTAQGTLSDF